MASTNLKEFNAGVRQFARENPAHFKIGRDKLALQGLTGVVKKSPVDTGRFRGNHQVTEGAAASGEVEALDTNGSTTIANGSAAIARAEPFGVVYITNNLPYAEALENGHSRQAPAGIYELTFQELVTQFG